MTTPPESSPGSRRGGRLSWFFRDPRTGKLVVGQWPNAAVWVWMALTGVRLSGVADEGEDALRWAAAGALTVWALDELVRGASPFRRTLGAVVLAWQVWRLGGTAL